MSILKESLSFFEEALRIDPGYPDAQAMIAVRRIQLREVGSLVELSKVIEEFPKCGLAYFWRGQFLFDAKKYKEAVGDWEIAWKLIPGRRPNIREGLRQARARLKSEESDPEWLQKVKHTHTHVNAREYDKARKEFADLVKFLPKETPRNQEQIQWLVLFSYNYACVLSVHADTLGKNDQKSIQDEALHWLDVACRLGWKKWQDQCHSSGNEHMMRDDDLKGLRDLTRFKRLVGYSEE